MYSLNTARDGDLWGCRACGMPRSGHSSPEWLEGQQRTRDAARERYPTVRHATSATSPIRGWRNEPRRSLQKFLKVRRPTDRPADRPVEPPSEFELAPDRENGSPPPGAQGSPKRNEIAAPAGHSSGAVTVAERILPAVIGAGRCQGGESGNHQGERQRQLG